MGAQKHGEHKGVTPPFYVSCEFIAETVLLTLTHLWGGGTGHDTISIKMSACTLNLLCATFVLPKIPGILRAPDKLLFGLRYPSNIRTHKVVHFPQRYTPFLQR